MNSRLFNWFLDILFTGVAWAIVVIGFVCVAVSDLYARVTGRTETEILDRDWDHDLP